MKRQFLPCAFLVLSCLLSPFGYGQEGKDREPRPNIIYIMVDDLGYADFACYGRKDVKTPNIDALVNSGVKFENAYAAAPVCTPTRVAFMTGRYPARSQVGLREPLTAGPADIDVGLSPSVPTVSSILKASGYETALFGKWHLGIGEEFFPRKHGFDNFFGILAGAADYADHRMVNRNTNSFYKSDLPVLFENETPVRKDGYLTDLITDYTTRFIRQRHNSPFFISVQFTSPHWPWQVPGDGPVPDTVTINTSGTREIYVRMIQNLDENLGRILKAVRDSGLEQNTMIILTSDNGGEKFSDMGAYKGGKMQLWEGGTRVPAAIRWPGVIAPNSKTLQPVITMDWTATILDASKSVYPDAIALDGISVLGLLKHPDKTIPRTFYWRTSNRISADALREGDWKYLRVDQDEFLFNLADDPYETNNLKDSMPAKFKEIQTAFLKLDKEMLAPLVLAR